MMRNVFSSSDIREQRLLCFGLADSFKPEPAHVETGSPETAAEPEDLDTMSNEDVYAESNALIVENLARLHMEWEQALPKMVAMRKEIFGQRTVAGKTKKARETKIRYLNTDARRSKDQGFIADIHEQIKQQTEFLNAARAEWLSLNQQLMSIIEDIKQWKFQKPDMADSAYDITGVRRGGAAPTDTNPCKPKVTPNCDPCVPDGATSRSPYATDPYPSNFQPTNRHEHLPPAIRDFVQKATAYLDTQDKDIVNRWMGKIVTAIVGKPEMNEGIEIWTKLLRTNETLDEAALNALSTDEKNAVEKLTTALALTPAEKVIFEHILKHFGEPLLSSEYEDDENAKAYTLGEETEPTKNTILDILTKRKDAIAKKDVELQNSLERELIMQGVDIPNSNLGSETPDKDVKMLPKNGLARFIPALMALIKLLQSLWNKEGKAGEEKKEEQEEKKEEDEEEKLGDMTKEQLQEKMKKNDERIKSISTEGEKIDAEILEIQKELDEKTATLEESTDKEKKPLRDLKDKMDEKMEARGTLLKELNKLKKENEKIQKELTERATKDYMGDLEKEDESLNEASVRQRIATLVNANTLNEKLSNMTSLPSMTKEQFDHAKQKFKTLLSDNKDKFIETFEIDIKDNTVRIGVNLSKIEKLLILAQGSCEEVVEALIPQLSVGGAIIRLLDENDQGGTVIYTEYLNAAELDELFKKPSEEIRGDDAGEKKEETPSLETMINDLKEKYKLKNIQYIGVNEDDLLKSMATIQAAMLNVKDQLIGKNIIFSSEEACAYTSENVAIIFNDAEGTMTTKLQSSLKKTGELKKLDSKFDALKKEHGIKNIFVLIEAETLVEGKLTLFQEVIGTLGTELSGKEIYFTTSDTYVSEDSKKIGISSKDTNKDIIIAKIRAILPKEEKAETLSLEDIFNNLITTYKLKAIKNEGNDNGALLKKMGTIQKVLSKYKNQLEGETIRFHPRDWPVLTSNYLHINYNELEKEMETKLESSMKEIDELKKLDSKFDDVKKKYAIKDILVVTTAKKLVTDNHAFLLQVVEELGKELSGKIIYIDEVPTNAWINSSGAYISIDASGSDKEAKKQEVRAALLLASGGVKLEPAKRGPETTDKLDGTSNDSSNQELVETLKAFKGDLTIEPSEARYEALMSAVSKRLSTQINSTDYAMEVVQFLNPDSTTLAYSLVIITDKRIMTPALFVRKGALVAKVFFDIHGNITSVLEKMDKDTLKQLFGEQKYDEVLTQLEKIMDPESAEAIGGDELNLYAYTITHLASPTVEQKRTALNCIETALKNDHDNLIFKDTKACVLVMLGQYDEAEIIWNEIIPKLETKIEEETEEADQKNLKSDLEEIQQNFEKCKQARKALEPQTTTETPTPAPPEPAPTEVTNKSLEATFEDLRGSLGITSFAINPADAVGVQTNLVKITKVLTEIGKEELDGKSIYLVTSYGTCALSDNNIAINYNDETDAMKTNIQRVLKEIHQLKELQTSLEDLRGSLGITSFGINPADAVGVQTNLVKITKVLTEIGKEELDGKSIYLVTLYGTCALSDNNIAINYNDETETMKTNIQRVLKEIKAK